MDNTQLEDGALEYRNIPLVTDGYIRAGITKSSSPSGLATHAFAGENGEHGRPLRPWLILSRNSLVGLSHHLVIKPLSKASNYLVKYFLLSRLAPTNSLWRLTSKVESRTHSLGDLRQTRLDYMAATFRRARFLVPFSERLYFTVSPPFADHLVAVTRIVSEGFLESVVNRNYQQTHLKTLFIGLVSHSITTLCMVI